MDESPTLNVMLGIEAVRDAIHFVNTQPADKVNTDLLVDALIFIYRSVGMEQDEASLLYRESIERYGDRSAQIMKEYVGG